MGVSFDAWLGTDAGAIPAASRAARAWFRIQRRPSQIAFRTPAGVTLAAQTLRIESDSNASPTESAAGANAKRRIVVFGIRGHPTLADSVIQDGFRFVLAGEEVRCEAVILQVGEIQGLFVAI